MTLAETAHLVTQLDLKDGLSPGMAKAEAATAGYGRAATAATGGTNRFARAQAGAGQAMSHFKGRVGDLTKMLGAAGLLGGVLGVTAAIKNGIQGAEEWGVTTDRLHQLTGASIKDASQFADAYEKLGVSQDKQVRIEGFLAKTLGNLNVNRKAAKKVEDDYGFSLIGSNGHMKNALQVTQDFTAYFNNKHIPSYQKAALGAKLFGRGWQDMIPVFEQGTKKMKEATAGAMSLDAGKVAQLHQWRDAQRELNDTVGDLSVQIGLAAIPALTDLSKGLNSFISDHQADIRDLFAKGLQMAKSFAGFIAHDVAPNLMNLGKAAVGFWNAIPGPLKDIITTGFVADRAVKFLFGFSPVGLVGSLGKDLIGGALKGVLGGFMQRGNSPANPLFVSGGAGGVGGAAGGGMGTLGKLGAAAGIAGSVAGVAIAVNQFMQDRAGEQAGLQTQATGLKNDPLTKAMADVTNMTRLLHDAQGSDRVGIDTFASKELQSALTNVADNILAKATTGPDITSGIAKLQAAQQQATEHGWTDLAGHIGKDIDALKAKTPGMPQWIAGMKRGNQPLLDAARANVSAVHKAEAAARGQRLDAKREAHVIAHLNQVETHKGNSAFIAESRRAARLVSQGTKDGLVTNAAKVNRAVHILEQEQVRAFNAGHTKLVRNLGSDIGRLQRVLGSKSDAINGTMRRVANKPPPTVNVTTNVTSTIGVRSLETARSTVTRYGASHAF